jgi:two-component system, NtrC family, sensor kinase
MRRRSRKGSTSVKSRRRKASTLKSRTAPKVRHRSSEAGQETEVVRLFLELSEARDQQVATADVLKVIGRSPSDVQPVFDMIAASATRLCKARHCSVFRFDGKLIYFAAEHGLSPEYIEAIRRTYPIPPGRTSAASRAVLTGNVAEIPDVQADPDYAHGTA